MTIAKWFAKSTAAIPGINVWELVIMAIIAMVGVTGLLGVSAGVGFTVLGTWGTLWYLSLIVFPTVYLLGQWMMPPNGLVVSMFAGLCIFIGACCVFAGMISITGTLFFAGWSGLVIFAVGSLARSIQAFSQLNRLQKVVIRYVTKEGNGVNRAGDSRIDS